MEEVGYWSTYKMPMPMESPRLSSAIIIAIASFPKTPFFPT